MGVASRILATVVSATLVSACSGMGGGSCGDSTYRSLAASERPETADYYCLAREGDSFSQYALGRMFEDGNMVPKDEKEAAKWYKRAARGSSGSTLAFRPNSQTRQQFEFEEAPGPGTPPNPDAQYALALMYRDGRGVGQSDSKYRSWLRRAAENGHVGAQEILEGEESS